MTSRRLSMRDIASEALAGLLQRPGRSLLTTLGTVLGIGSFVAILGLTATASGQIDKRFSALLATTVLVTDADPPIAGNATSFPADATARVLRIRGTVAAGVHWPIAEGSISTRPPAPSSVASATDAGIGVEAADPGALAAFGTRLSSGRAYDAFAQGRGARVAVLGAVAAQSLGISRLDAQPAVFLGGLPYTVIGIASSFARAPGQSLSVLIPTSSALRDFPPPNNPTATMLVVTRLGAAKVVARQLAVALRPERPDAFTIQAPADPERLRNGVSRDTRALFLAAAAASLLIGALGIVNTTLVSVLERSAEIGLRRALGARRSEIALQFLTESLALGSIGGVVGTALAVAVTVAVAASHRWTAILPTAPTLLAPVIGALVGLLAGVYPAARAACIEPVRALQR